MKVEHIQAKDAPAPGGSYSHGVVANNFLYTCGMGPIDPATGKVVEGGVAEIDKVASELREVSPQRFHDTKSVELRVFYNEPRQSVPNAGFIMPYPSRTRA